MVYIINRRNQQKTGCDQEGGQIERIRKHDRVFLAFTLLKFALPVVLSLFALRLTGSPVYCFAVLAECLIAFLITNIISSWSIIASWAIGVIAMFTVYAQSLVLLFTGNYVLLIMLTNLDSIEAIKGRAVQYIFMIILSLIALFLPIRKLKVEFVKHGIVLALICLITVGWVPFMLEDYSPYANLIWLVEKIQLKKQTEERIHGMMADGEGADELRA